jgi:photosystem II stability/assembly factor-like uncharacterized protein
LLEIRYRFWMPKSVLTLILALALLSTVFQSAIAQAPQVPKWRVEAMKLVAPDLGWALANHHLFWTTDNGANWKDIMPARRAGSDEHISHVFALDAHDIWLLYAQHGDPVCKFDLAHSGDTGATWSWMPVTLPPELQHGLAGEGTLAFVDDLHGWMILNSARATASGFRAGALLVTSDRGRNWRDTHDDDPGGQGPVVLLTPAEGWMVGGEHDDDLHVTRDGAKSWQTISLPAPKEISLAKFATADVPTFEDSKHGFVAVTYTGSHQSAAVLFATDDGGRNWKADRIQSNLEETAAGRRVQSAVVGDIWLIAQVADHRPILTALRAGARMRATIDPASHKSGYFGTDQLSFVTPSQGWVLVDHAQLLSTTDGGATWTDITPK